jgi:CBS domain-containing protein
MIMKYKIVRDTANWKDIESEFRNQTILPVVRDGEILVGFVKEGDHEPSDDVTVGEVLQHVLNEDPSRLYFQVPESSQQKEAFSKMQAFQTNFVPVVQADGTLKGIVDISNLEESS